MGLYFDKKTRAEKWGIVKKIAATITLVSWAAMIGLGIRDMAYQKGLKEDVNALAKENGYVETIDRDEFMKNSENVSKEEYAKYSQLKQEIEDTKTSALIQTAVLGVTGLVSGGVYVKASIEEDEIFPIY